MTEIRDLPTVRNWKISRSGAGLRIHGNIDGKVGRMTVDDVICTGGIIYACRDNATIAHLVLEMPAAAIAANRAA